MFVYVIVNSETLKIYIGQHKGNNLRKYLQDKLSHAKLYPLRRSHLNAAMRAYPSKVWSIHSLVSDLQTRDEVNHWERFYIKALKSQHRDVGYNICDGGEGFTGPQSESAKAKITAALIGRPVSEETRAKIGSSQPRSPEQLAVLKVGREKPKSPETIEKNRKNRAGGLQAGQHSEETLMRMSDSAKRRGISSETHQKMLVSRAASGWNIGHPSTTTPEGIAKMRATKTGKPWSADRRAASSNPTGTRRMTSAEAQARYRFLKTVAWG